MLVLTRYTHPSVRSTHLTDFTSSPRPNIPTASLKDMISLNPADLVTKLKLLFEVVVILFGLLHIGAAVAWVMDSREKKHVAERLLDPACGYRVTEDGVSLWRFGLDPLPDEIAAPTGPAIELAAIFGLPMARLRAAMPDEMFTTDFAAALGRRHGFSASGIASTRDHHRDLLDTSRRSSVRTPRLSFVSAKLAGADVDTAESSTRTLRRTGSSDYFADSAEPQSPTRVGSPRSPRSSSGASVRTPTAAAALRQSEVESWDLEHRTALEEFVVRRLLLRRGSQRALTSRLALAGHGAGGGLPAGDAAAAGRGDCAAARRRGGAL